MSPRELGDAGAALAGLGLITTVMAGLWLASLRLRDASLVDRFWGGAFVLLAAFYALTAPYGGVASLTLLAAVTTWGLRLSFHLTVRNWGRGEDFRYRAMRETHGPRFGLVSLFTVFLLQGLLVWIIAFPLFAGLRAAVAPSPLVLAAGIVVWTIGFGFEVLGDAQLARHRADPGRRGRVLDTGVWRYTRHPNYFGDATLWWGHWLMAASVGGSWTVFAPLLMTFLLLRVSGVTLLEKKLTETRPDYAAYAARTPAFFPRLWPRRARGPDR